MRGLWLGLALLCTGAFAQNPIANSGKYAVELRVPSEGIFASEELDIEFRVMDSAQNDPVLGMAGIPNCTVTSAVTMPAMPGMPEMRPAIHKEGVPGDYGLTTYFPHGGEYAISLKVTPPGATAFVVQFTVDVKDERPPKGKPLPKPYALALKDVGPRAAGVPTPLILSVLERQSGKIVRDFDEAHTRRFHLLLASKDFGWFEHLHPDQLADGSWSIDATFPASGIYYVYGDVAPVGKGSMILMNKVTVTGPAQTWKAPWTQNLGPTTDGDLTGVLTVPGGTVPIGQMTTVQLTLTVPGTGKPVTTLKPWLGAWGHLMVFSSDGITVVHSHPADSSESDAQAAKGIVRFNARFPKPGNYRAFAQFDTGSAVRTLAFTLVVKP